MTSAAIEKQSRSICMIGQRRWRCRKPLFMLHSLLYGEHFSSSIDYQRMWWLLLFQNTREFQQTIAPRTFCIRHVSQYLAYNYGSFNGNTCTREPLISRTPNTKGNNKLTTMSTKSAFILISNWARILNYEWYDCDYSRLKISSPLVSSTKCCKRNNYMFLE